MHKANSGNSVVVPYSSLPGFWTFMYRVSPITYIVKAMLSTGVGRHDVQCSELELILFQPPAGQTCGEYLMSFPVGSLYNPTATSNCQYCPMESTDQFLESVGIYYDERFRDYGLIWAYIVFNICATFVLYWLARVPKKMDWRRLFHMATKDV